MRVNVSSIRDFKGLDNKLYELRYIPTLADKAMFIIRDKMTYGNNLHTYITQNKFCSSVGKTSARSRRVVHQNGTKKFVEEMKQIFY